MAAKLIAFFGLSVTPPPVERLRILLDGARDRASLQAFHEDLVACQRLLTHEELEAIAGEFNRAGRLYGRRRSANGPRKLV